MKYSASQTFGWNPMSLNGAKSKKEGNINVKLTKILVNLQPKAMKKPNFFEMAKSANNSISQRSTLDNSDRSVHKKDFNNSRLSRNLNETNTPRLGSISMRQKAPIGHVRSVSNGESYNAANMPLIEKQIEHHKRPPSVKKDDKKPSSYQFKVLQSTDLQKGLNALEKIEKHKNFNHRTLAKNARHRSMVDLKEGIQEMERENIVGKYEKEYLNYPEEAFSLRNSLKSPKREEAFQWKNLVFSNVSDRETIKKHVKSVIEGLNYALNHLKAPSYSFIESRQISLEKKTNFPKTLILDLDETLINSCLLEDQPDLILTPKVGSDIKIMIKVRPYVQQFLSIMKEHFEILVFTASSELYAKTVVQALDPNEEYISHILHRDYCLETNRGIRIKDLRIIKNRHMKDMIIVDNFVPAFSFQLENGVPILEWRGDRKDQELLHIAKYLIGAKTCDDFREYNRRNLKLLDLVNLKWQALISHRP